METNDPGRANRRDAKEKSCNGDAREQVNALETLENSVKGDRKKYKQLCRVWLANYEIETSQAAYTRRSEIQQAHTQDMREE